MMSNIGGLAKELSIKSDIQAIGKKDIDLLVPFPLNAQTHTLTHAKLEPNA